MSKDYTKFSNSHKQEVEVTPEVEEPVEVEETPCVEKDGIVTDCIKLNVRKEPSVTADIVCEINASTKLAVYEDESTEDFYKICTFSGIEGYCMRKFITVMP